MVLDGAEADVRAGGVDGQGEVQLGVDERPIEVENKQIKRPLNPV